MSNFNPRTHVGCDSVARQWKSEDKQFQSTHPRGVRHQEGWSLDRFNKFQSTHPRGVRRQYPGEPERSQISIHAPTWGATDLRGRVAPGDVISIHAPTWGATRFGGVFRVEVRFQSTHPRGVRPHPEHSSAHDSDFNPRTHVGCDRAYFLRHDKTKDFNPRTHVGCDAEAALL